MIASPYYEMPGFKAGGTSAAAAFGFKLTADSLRTKVFELLQHEPLTADECAARLNESILSIRPRLSELNTAGRICKTDARRRNASGLYAHVWTVKGGQP